jgi:hypothetical protein
VLAVYHGYSSLIILGTCLVHLGGRDGIKGLNPKLLKGQFKTLLAASVSWATRAEAAGKRRLEQGPGGSHEASRPISGQPRLSNKYWSFTAVRCRTEISDRQGIADPLENY